MRRREFVTAAAWLATAGILRAQPPAMNPAGTIRLVLTGDVMTGRGIDQILANPGSPVIHERYVRDARDYVDLAARASGTIPIPADWPYIWGDALADWQDFDPLLRFINLETSITGRGTPWPGKGIQYRMHPDNVRCLSTAGIDACTLANNHVLDWDYAGLAETLSTLRGNGIITCGAGANIERARTPARLALPGGGALLVYACGTTSSGIPREWAARPSRAGVNLLPDLTAHTLRRVVADIDSVRRRGDRVIVSIHWGGNWGYGVPTEQQDFARGLVDAGVDLVHGHSSHHFKAMELRARRLILYGCGDFITDYEGIEGHESFRPDLSLGYLVTLDREDGRLLQLDVIPYQLRRMTLTHASASDQAWVAGTLAEESSAFGVPPLRHEAERLVLRPAAGHG